MEVDWSKDESTETGPRRETAVKLRGGSHHDWLVVCPIQYRRSPRMYCNIASSGGETARACVGREID